MLCETGGMDPFREALHEIVDTLGPFTVCSCGCEGLREEAQEALDIARKALGLMQVV